MYGYSGYQHGPPLTFGGMGAQATPFGGPQHMGQLQPMAGGMGGMGGAQGGGWLDALGRWTGLGDVQGLDRAQLLASTAGGVFDALERRGERQEEQRRYEQALEESRKHRRAMGQNLNSVWGG